MITCYKLKQYFSRISYSTRLPSICVEYLEEVNRCFLCGRFGTDFLPIYMNYCVHELAALVICSVNSIPEVHDRNITIEFHCCSPFCGDNSKFFNYGLTRNIGTFIWAIEKKVKLRIN